MTYAPRDYFVPSLLSCLLHFCCGNMRLDWIPKTFIFFCPFQILGPALVACISANIWHAGRPIICAPSFSDSMCQRERSMLSIPRRPHSPHRMAHHTQAYNCSIQMIAINAKNTTEPASRAFCARSQNPNSNPGHTSPSMWINFPVFHTKMYTCIELNVQW
jgi:hypothetical protein